MRRRPSWLRILAGTLMIAQFQACAPTWKSTAAVTPADAVEGWQPDIVRVRLRDGTTVRVAEPRVIGDSLRGMVEVGGSWERVAQALADIERLEVKAIPKIAERPGPAAGGGVIVRGERLRVTYQAESRMRTGQGRLDGLDEDVLILSHDQGPPTRIPVETIAKVEAQIGTKSNAGSGALVGLIGAVVVVGLGAILYAAAGDDTGSGCCGNAPILWGAGVLGLGVLVIATAGGAISRREAWEVVPLDLLRGARSTAGSAEHSSGASRGSRTLMQRWRP